MIDKRKDFIEWLNKEGIHYSEFTENGLDQVYVYHRRLYEKKHQNPCEYKNLSVPYLRVSQFDGLPEVYVRDNGFCYYGDIQDVIKECVRLNEM